MHISQLINVQALRDVSSVLDRSLMELNRQSSSARELLPDIIAGLGGPVGASLRDRALVNRAADASRPFGFDPLRGSCVARRRHSR